MPERPVQVQASSAHLKAVQDFIDYCWARNVKPDARQVLLAWVPHPVAEALAEALERIVGGGKACSCPGCSALNTYRARHPKETS